MAAAGLGSGSAAAATFHGDDAGDSMTLAQLVSVLNADDTTKVADGLWDAVDVIQAEIASHAALQLTPGAAGSSAAAADNLLSSWKPVLRPKKGLLFAYSEASPQCSEVFAQLSVLPRRNTSGLAVALMELLSLIVSHAPRHVATAAAKRAMREFTSILTFNIGCTSPHVIRATVKLLAALAALNGATARELLTRIPLSHKAFQEMSSLRGRFDANTRSGRASASSKLRGLRSKSRFTRRKAKQAVAQGSAGGGPPGDDARAWLVRYVCRLLGCGAGDVQHSVLRSSELLQAVSSGVEHDEATVVQEWCATIQHNIVGDARVPASLALSVVAGSTAPAGSGKGNSTLLTAGLPGSGGRKGGRGGLLVPLLTLYDRHKHMPILAPAYAQASAGTTETAMLSVSADVGSHAWNVATHWCPAVIVSSRTRGVSPRGGLDGAVEVKMMVHQLALAALGAAGGDAASDVFARASAVAGTLAPRAKEQLVGILRRLRAADDKLQGELLQKVLAAHASALPAYLSVFPLAVEPRHTDKWAAVSALLLSLMAAPVTPRTLAGAAGAELSTLLTSTARQLLRGATAPAQQGAAQDMRLGTAGLSSSAAAVLRATGVVAADAAAATDSVVVPPAFSDGASKLIPVLTSVTLPGGTSRQALTKGVLHRVPMVTYTTLQLCAAVLRRAADVCTAVTRLAQQCVRAAAATAGAADSGDGRSLSASSALQTAIADALSAELVAGLRAEVAERLPLVTTLVNARSAPSQKLAQLPPRALPGVESLHKALNQDPETPATGADAEKGAQLSDEDSAFGVASVLLTSLCDVLTALPGALPSSVHASRFNWPSLLSIGPKTASGSAEGAFSAFLAGPESLQGALLRAVSSMVPPAHAQDRLHKRQAVLNTDGIVPPYAVASTLATWAAGTTHLPQAPPADALGVAMFALTHTRDSNVRTAAYQMLFRVLSRTGAASTDPLPLVDAVAAEAAPAPEEDAIVASLAASAARKAGAADWKQVLAQLSSASTGWVLPSEASIVMETLSGAAAPVHFAAVAASAYALLSSGDAASALSAAAAQQQAAAAASSALFRSLCSAVAALGVAGAEEVAYLLLGADTMQPAVRSVLYALHSLLRAQQGTLGYLSTALLPLALAVLLAAVAPLGEPQYAAGEHITEDAAAAAGGLRSGGSVASFATGRTHMSAIQARAFQRAVAQAVALVRAHPAAAATVHALASRFVQSVGDAAATAWLCDGIAPLRIAQLSPKEAADAAEEDAVEGLEATPASTAAASAALGCVARAVGADVAHLGVPPLRQLAQETVDAAVAAHSTAASSPSQLPAVRTAAAATLAAAVWGGSDAKAVEGALCGALLGSSATGRHIPLMLGAVLGGVGGAGGGQAVGPLLSGVHGVAQSTKQLIKKAAAALPADGPHLSVVQSVQSAPQDEASMALKESLAAAARKTLLSVAPAVVAAAVGPSAAARNVLAATSKSPATALGQKVHTVVVSPGTAPAVLQAARCLLSSAHEEAPAALVSLTAAVASRRNMPDAHKRAAYCLLELLLEYALNKLDASAAVPQHVWAAVASLTAAVMSSRGSAAMQTKEDAGTSALSSRTEALLAELLRRVQHSGSELSLQVLLVAADTARSMGLRGPPLHSVVRKVLSALHTSVAALGTDEEVGDAIAAAVLATQRCLSAAGVSLVASLLGDSSLPALLACRQGSVGAQVAALRATVAKVLASAPAGERLATHDALLAATLAAAPAIMPALLADSVQSERSIAHRWAAASLAQQLVHTHAGTGSALAAFVGGAQERFAAAVRALQGGEAGAVAAVFAAHAAMSSHSGHVDASVASTADGDVLSCLLLLPAALHSAQTCLWAWDGDALVQLLSCAALAVAHQSHSATLAGLSGDTGAGLLACGAAVVAAVDTLAADAQMRSTAGRVLGYLCSAKVLSAAHIKVVAVSLEGQMVAPACMAVPLACVRAAAQHGVALDAKRSAALGAAAVEFLTAALPVLTLTQAAASSGSPVEAALQPEAEDDDDVEITLSVPLSVAAFAHVGAAVGTVAEALAGAVASGAVAAGAAGLDAVRSLALSAALGAVTLADGAEAGDRGLLLPAGTAAAVASLAQALLAADGVAWSNAGGEQGVITAHVLFSVLAGCEQLLPVLLQGQPASFGPLALDAYGQAAQPVRDESRVQCVLEMLLSSVLAAEDALACAPLVPVLLAAYRCSLSQCDRLVRRLLHACSRQGHGPAQVHWRWGAAAVPFANPKRVQQFVAKRVVPLDGALEALQALVQGKPAPVGEDGDVPAAAAAPLALSAFQGAAFAACGVLARTAEQLVVAADAASGLSAATATPAAADDVAAGAWVLPDPSTTAGLEPLASRAKGVKRGEKKRLDSFGRDDTMEWLFAFTDTLGSGAAAGSHVQAGLSWSRLQASMAHLPIYRGMGDEPAENGAQGDSAGALLSPLRWNDSQADAGEGGDVWTDVLTHSLGAATGELAVAAGLQSARVSSAGARSTHGAQAVSGGAVLALLPSAGHAREVYDPSFLLPVVAFALADGGAPLPKFVSSGLLPFVTTCLSSARVSVREAGYGILSTYLQAIEPEQLLGFRERTQVQLVLSVLRSSVQKPLQRLPSMLTSFVADALLLAMQSHKAMYEQVSRFLLGRPDGSLSHRDTPLFLTSLHSVSANTTGHRGWLLRYLCRAVHASADYNALERRHGLSLLLSTLSAPYLDKYGHSMILAFLARVASLRVPFIAAAAASGDGAAAVADGSDAEASDAASDSDSDSSADSDSDDSDSDSGSDSSDSDSEDEEGDVSLVKGGDAAPAPTAAGDGGVDRSDVLPLAGPRVGIAALRMWRGNGALAQLAFVLANVQEPLGQAELGSAKDAVAVAHATRSMQLVCATLRAVYVSSVQFVHQREAGEGGAMYTHPCGPAGVAAPTAPDAEATNVRIAALGSEFALLAQQLVQAAVRVVRSRQAALTHLAALGQEELLLVEEEQAADGGEGVAASGAGDDEEEHLAEEQSDAKLEAQARARRSMAQALGVAASAMQLQLHMLHWVAAFGGGSVLAAPAGAAPLKGLACPMLPQAAVLQAAAESAATATPLHECADVAHSVLLVAALLLQADAAWTALSTNAPHAAAGCKTATGAAVLRCMHVGDAAVSRHAAAAANTATQAVLLAAPAADAASALRLVQTPQAARGGATATAHAALTHVLGAELTSALAQLHGEGSQVAALASAWQAGAVPSGAALAPPAAESGAGGVAKSAKKAKKRQREESAAATPVKRGEEPRLAKTTAKKKAKSSKKKARRESR